MCSFLASLIVRWRCNKSQTRNLYRAINYRDYAATNRNCDKIKETSNFNKYWISRYMAYVKNYPATLHNKFPKAMHVYRIFSIGSKEFYSDLKRYISIKKIQKSKGFNSLTPEQLQLLHTFPKDLIKISPLFVISAIPFTNYIIFPTAYLFPRLLLTHHFWSLEQRLTFMLHYHKKRLRHNKPLFRCLQSKLETIEKSSLKIKWSGIVACLGSGTHPLPSEVIECIELFSEHPYSLNSLSRKHTKRLLAVHGMHKWTPFKKQRLLERGMLIKTMDNAIKRTGGIGKLSNETIRWALSFRGVNPANMSRDCMQDWFEQWLQISIHVEERSISLLLHSPILLAYNYPTNWTLLYH